MPRRNGASSKVARAQGALVAIALARAALWGAAALFAVLAIDRHLPLFSRACAFTAFAVSVWRDRFAWSAQRVALWIEERAPQLKYALVTLTDPHIGDAPMLAVLDEAVSRVDMGPLLWRAAKRSLQAPVLFLAAAVLCFATLPVMRRETPTPPATGVPAGSPLPNRLLKLTGTLTPPAYTGWPVQALNDPDTVQGLVGSQAVLNGQGGPEGIQARLGDQPIPVVAGGVGGWTLAFTLPPSAAPLTLTDRKYKRIVVVDPRPDLPPLVKLRLPSGDFTLHELTGSLTLQADLTDDVGLAQGNFEYIISSGEGEGNFAARSGTFGEQRFGKNALSGRLETTVPYSWFKLDEGDQLSVRAVATDGNTLSGPGKGYSETRIIRVARKNARPDIDVNPAPPPFDPTLMSLRMVIVATEKLEARRATMPHADFVKAVQPLSAQAVIIRGKVKALIDDQSQRGMFSVSPLLTEAYQDMWDGCRSLAIAETGEALPPLRDAWEALKKLSNAAKYYFRGQSPPVAVDVDKVRMKGEEKVAASARTARGAVTTPEEQFAGRYAQAVLLLRTDPEGAIDQLTLLRVDALNLRDEPALAAALEEVLSDLRAGRDPAASLLKARQTIDGDAKSSPTLPTWSPLP